MELLYHSKPNGKRLTLDQIKLLEANFRTNQNPSSESKVELAKKLQVQVKQVGIWYQNRRARQKTQTIELDYQTVQQKLEKALEDKRWLEREVGMLRHELDKTQKQLYAYNSSASSSAAAAAIAGVAPVYSTSGSGDDDFAPSSSLDDMQLSWEEAKKVEELYACLIGSKGQD